MEPNYRKNSGLEIWTPSGWSNFKGIKRKLVDTTQEIIIDKKTLKCTVDHLVKIDGIFRSVNGKIIKKEVYVYDPIDVEKNNEYFSNGLISHNCDFQGSSGTLIAGWKIKELVVQAPIVERDGLNKYKEPIKSHRYAIIVDTSEGKGLDYSAFSVFDITEMPYEQVMAYRSNLITPGDYAEIIYRVAKAYNDPIILGEHTSLWPGVADTLYYTYEYEGLLSTESAGAKGKRITTKSGKGVDKGLKISVQSKAVGCSMLKLLVEQNQLILNDYNTIQEISRFVKKKNSYEAEEGWNDDLVMGLVLFGWLSNQDWFKSQTEIDTIKELREKRNEQIEADMMPFGFVDNGPPATEITTAELIHQIASIGYTKAWDLVHKPAAPQMQFGYSPYVYTGDDSDEDVEKLDNF